MARRRRPKIVRDANSFRERAEQFIALAQRVEKAPKSDVRDRLLNDAKKTVGVVQTVMRHADDTRNWARSMFGEKADAHPIMEFASDALTKTLNMTMGFQAYRMQQFLAGKRVAFGPHPVGVAALSALTQFVEH